MALENLNEIDSRKIIEPIKTRFAKVIKDKCSVFGAIGKAKYDI